MERRVEIGRRTLREDRTAGASATPRLLLGSSGSRSAWTSNVRELGPPLCDQTDLERHARFNARSVAPAVETSGSRGESRPCGTLAN
jgi:hypothetical protein